MLKIWICILVLSPFLKGPECLSNLRVSVPGIVLRGETTSFNCSWDQDPRDKVWAVKWYRGNFEIFRFIQEETPPTKVFPLDNFHVDPLLSDGRTLWLRDVNFDNTGEYSCEVIADRTFLTLIKSGYMQVVDLPDEKPRITGIKEKYQIGETLEALCTSWQSHPPANLTWFINEEPARTEYLRPQKTREEYDDTFTSVLGLRFEISRHHFVDGKIKIKCTSSLLTIYWQSTMVELQEASPRLGRVVGHESDSTSDSKMTGGTKESGGHKLPRGPTGQLQHLTPAGKVNGNKNDVDISNGGAVPAPLGGDHHGSGGVEVPAEPRPVASSAWLLRGLSAQLLAVTVLIFEANRI